MRLLVLILLIISAVGLAGAGFLFIKGSSSAPIVEQAPKTFVVVPKTDLFRGHVVRADDLTWVEWPEDLSGNYIASKDKNQSTITGLYGRIVRTEVQGNVPLLEKSLISKKTAGGLISSLLSDNKRAYTIAVGPDTGGAGFILPGDYVDIILIQNIRDMLPRLEMDDAKIQLSDEILNATAETIMRNIKVLAVGNKTSVARDSKDSSVTPVESITVELSQKESEKLALAKTLGTLSVALRSLAGESSILVSDDFVADTTASRALGAVLESLEEASKSKSLGSERDNIKEQNTSKNTIKIYSGKNVIEKKMMGQ
jgi:pilus assembly protein CpaB